MEHIATITTAATITALTTLETVKEELGITTTSSDAILTRKIDEATSDIEAHLGRTFCRETITETFWGWVWKAPEYLTLDRAPVASIASVTVDDVTLSSNEYRLDADTGILYRLDPSGYPWAWCWCKSIVVVYDGGYLLPGQTDRNLPAAVEGGAIALMGNYWIARGRDGSVKSEEVPGVMRIDYWTGAVGTAGELPPDVTTRLAPFRRVLI
jgi:uncharacterized phiE125 gp8 family phage protein